MEIARVVGAVHVGDEPVEQGAEFLESVAVGVVPGEPGHLVPHHEADLPLADVRHERLEPHASFRGSAGSPLVFIQQTDSTGRPSEFAEANLERPLVVAALAVRMSVLFM